MPSHRAPFPDEPGPIGMLADGRAISLHPITAGDAAVLGSGLAAIDPWARAGRTAEQMQTFIGRQETSACRYRIACAGDRAGVMIVREPWLHGPYLHVIGLLPAYHGQGIGHVALDWLEAESVGHFRNLWLCVSSFNVRARRLYEAKGFRLAGTLDDLVLDGLDELLMRKKLFPDRKGQA